MPTPPSAHAFRPSPSYSARSPVKPPSATGVVVTGIAVVLAAIVAIILFLVL